MPGQAILHASGKKKSIDQVPEELIITNRANQTSIFEKFALQKLD